MLFSKIIFYIPNLLSIFRIISPIPLVIMYKNGLYLGSLILFAVSALSDFFDGFFARKLKVTSFLGAVLDGAADKVLVNSIFILLYIYSELPFWFISISLFRDIAISILSILFFNSMHGKPHVLFVSKINTTLQLLLITLIYCSKVFGIIAPFVKNLTIFSTAFFTIVSAVSYAVYFIRYKHE